MVRVETLEMVFEVIDGEWNQKLWQENIADGVSGIKRRHPVNSGVPTTGLFLGPLLLILYISCQKRNI